MGIAGLLPQLKSVATRTNVSKYAGKRAAVDAYCLLHRGAFCCSRELVEGEPTDKHIQYCMARIDLLLRAGVTPVVVLDGANLPCKGEEELTRKRSRDEARARARSLWQQGNHTAAYECYQKAVDITPSVAKGFVEALKRRGVEFVVAPYEADAQMAYLALNGHVDVVVTEDSDMVAYGCPTVFFKMDKGGEGEEVRLHDLPDARELNLVGFTHEMFQEMCVMAGCDFVKALPGIAVKKAHAQIKRTRCFLKAVRAIKFNGVAVPPDYTKKCQRALWVFRHQRVYCPVRKQVVHLHEVAGGNLAAGARVPDAAVLVDGEEDFLGPQMPDDVARGIAEGDLDPITKLPFEEDLLQPSTAPLADEPAFSRRAAQQQAQPSGRWSGKQGAANNGGNTLANYKGFSSQGPLQQQERQGAGGAPAAQQQHQQHQNPAELALAAGIPTSPTGEQWEAFRRKREELRRSGTGMAGRRAAPAPAPSQQQQQQQPDQPQLGRAAPRGLLANLRAALQQNLAVQEAAPAAAVQQPAALLQRPPFAPPLRRQPTSASELGLPASPTIEEVLEEGGAAAAAARGGALYSLPCSPRPSQQLGDEQPRQLQWMPQPAAAGPAIPFQVSPLGGEAPPLLQQPGGAGITPGFYAALSSEAQSGDHMLHSLPPGEPLATPVNRGMSGEQLQQLQDAARQQLAACPPRPPAPRAPVALHQTFDAAACEEEQQLLHGPSPRGGDPMADLSHLPACERLAKVAVDRAFAAACEGAMQQQMRELPPPPHLQQQKQQQYSGQRQAQPKRCLPTPGEKQGTAGSGGQENSFRYGPPAGGTVKRHKTLADNMFSRFAFSQI